MRLTFLGKDSQPNQSPTLYVTDQGSYVVQGWIVPESDVLAGIVLADNEADVEVPAKLMTHLANDGIRGEVVNLVAPIVQVRENGNYIVKGTSVTDAEALAQMDIPDHETCVEVPCSAVVALVDR